MSGNSETADDDSYSIISRDDDEFSRDVRTARHASSDSFKYERGRLIVCSRKISELKENPDSWDSTSK
jgi:hypothetical protein